MNEIYLDHAATSHPKPDEVINAVMNALTNDNANPGRSSYQRAIRASKIIFEARKAVGEILNAYDPMEIAFTYNCTDAINLGIKGVVQAGDHVICSSLEHNSVLRVLGEMQNNGFINLDIVPPKPNGYTDPKDYLKRICKNTRLMILTHASNVTGAVQPVEAVGRIAGSFGIPYLIDGAQAVGEREIDVKRYGCDMYAFAGHKGLLGPQGTGGLFVHSRLTLKPFRVGGTGSASESILPPLEAPDRYEAGTMNLPGIAGLLEGAKYVKKHKSEIFGNIRHLTNRLYDGLSSIKGVTVYSPANSDFRTGVVSFNVCDLYSQDAAEYLSAHGFCVRSGIHCAPFAHRFLKTESRGAVRASVGYANTCEEIDLFVERVYHLSKTQGPAR